MDALTDGSIDLAPCAGGSVSVMAILVSFVFGALVAALIFVDPSPPERYRRRRALRRYYDGKEHDE